MVQDRGLTIPREKDGDKWEQDRTEGKLRFYEGLKRRFVSSRWFQLLIVRMGEDGLSDFVESVVYDRSGWSLEFRIRVLQ